MDFQKILSHSTKKPRNILKIVLSFSVALLVLWIFLVSRMEFSGTERAVPAEVQERTEGLKSSLNKNESPTITPEKPKEAVSETKSGSEGIFQNAFTTFLVMIGGLGLVWMWAKNKSGSQQVKEDSRDLGEHILGQGAQLKFVEINNEVWVLGMTSGSLNLLHRVPKAEWMESEEIEEIGPVKNGTPDFSSLYKMFRN